jgi:uncharacterized metal-binding protein YceD (DUF177 family)
MKMKKLREYDIKFTGLKNGKHRFTYQIDKDFLDHFPYNEADDCDVQVDVELNKSDTMLEFSVKSKGTVNVPCDISNEMYDQEIEGDLDFIVKFGDQFNDEREDLIIIPYGEHTYNVAQQIYEDIILNIPLKKIHPDIKSGKKKAKAQEYIINEEENKKENKEQYDPRWEALKKLLTDKKK